MVALANVIRAPFASVGRLFAAVGDPFNDRWWPSGDTYTTAAGVRVTTPGVIEHSAVFACLQLLANGTIGTPLKVFRRLDDGSREPARQHPLYRVLNEAPNPYQTPATWKSQLVVDLLLYGNYYARIRLDRHGNIESLWPIHPDSIRKVELLPNGNTRYTVKMDDGTDKVFNGEDILHVRGLSLNGLTGVPLLQYAKNAIGLGLSASQYGAGFFARPPRPAGIVTHPGNLSVEALQRFKGKIEADHGGANTGKSILVVDEGVTWTATPVMSNEDADLINTLRWSTTQIAQFFGVPPHLIGETSGTTTLGSSKEESNIMFFMLAMGPKFIVIQEECERGLLTDEDRENNYYIEFIPNALQWMTPKARAEYYQMIAGGPAPIMTVAEIRPLENLPFIPGTDVLLQPLNMGGRPDTTENQKQPNPAARVAAEVAATDRTTAFLLEAMKPAATAGDIRARLNQRDTIIGLVRKEITAMSRQAQRAAGDHTAWWEEIDTFYAEHAVTLAAKLHIPAKAAEDYCAKQALELKAGTAKVMEDGPTTRVVDLLALVDREKWEVV